MSTSEIEQRSLSHAKWASLFMGVAGITAAIASNATALMLDGLFSGVNFVAALFAARVAKDISRQPDPRRPFGYEIHEPMYVMFRSLVLVGVLIVALVNALAKVVAYLRGESIDEVILGPVVAYMVLMIAICFGLAVRHHRNWLRTGRASELLKTERAAAIVDGVLSAAAGLAFIGMALLRNTPLAFLTPISDSIVVTCLAVYMIPQPIRLFRKAAREVAGEGAPPEMVQDLRANIRAALKNRPYTLLDILATRAGRTLFVLSYIRPDQPSSAAELDRVRENVRIVCSSVHGHAVSDIIFTAEAAYGGDGPEDVLSGQPASPDPSGLPHHGAGKRDGV